MFSLRRLNTFIFARNIMADYKWLRYSGVVLPNHVVCIQILSVTPVDTHAHQKRDLGLCMHKVEGWPCFTHTHIIDKSNLGLYTHTDSRPNLGLYIIQTHGLNV